MTPNRTDDRQETRQKKHPGCCPPRAQVWMECDATNVYVENSLQSHHRLAVRADVANTAVAQPQTIVQDGASDSELEDVTSKAQGKVYRTDHYTIHWRAEGQCRPLHVVLAVSGETAYQADCLPEEGSITLSRAYLLEPPAYAPPGPGSVVAELDVTDCAGQASRCRNEVPRP